MPANYNQKFKEAFSQFEDYYVIIGGTATSFILDTRGFASRTTKDYDMVVTKADTSFYQAITAFLKDGDYSPEVGPDNQLYRFTTANSHYPKMIELFSKEPFSLAPAGRTTPLPFGDDFSLSALLLDDDYYDLLIGGREILNGYSILKDKYLIIFKAKAWLDLSLKREAGDKSITSTNIKKHLNDIARLVGSLNDMEKPQLLPTIQIDITNFLNRLKENMELIPQNDDIVLSRDEIFEYLSELLG